MSDSLDFGEAWRFFDSLLDYCNCPETGSFNGWKGAIILHDYDGKDVLQTHAEYCIVKLGIPEDSPRLRAKNSKKCRCEFAEVLDIQRKDGSSFPDDTVVYSLLEVNNQPLCNPARYKTRYKKGKRVYADSFDEDRENECSHGIHFFMHREDAVAYIGL